MVFRRGLALCLVLGFASFASAQTISFSPNGGTFAPGQVVNVDVLVTQSTGVNKLLRYEQFDFTATTALLRSGLVLPVTHSGAPGTIKGFDFNGLTTCPAANNAGCGTGQYIEDELVVNVLRPNIIAAAYKELAADATKQVTLVSGAPKKVAQLTLTMPLVNGPYTLDVVNAAGAGNVDASGELRWGFGITGDVGLDRFRPGTGLLGGTAVFTVGPPTGVDLIPGQSLPGATAGTGPNANTIRVLSRTTRNEVRLDFTGNLPGLPPAGAIKIRELQTGVGAFGPELAGFFAATIADSATLGVDTARLILKDNGSNLVHKKWYAVESTAAWTGVNPFCLHFLVMAGDCNGDGNVNAADLTCVNSSIPTVGVPATTDALFRKDILAGNTGGINAADLSAANGQVPTLLATAPKPTGHTTCP